MSTLIKLEKDHCSFYYEGHSMCTGKIEYKNPEFLETIYFFKYKNYYKDQEISIDNLYYLDTILEYPRCEDNYINRLLAPFFFTHYVQNIEPFPYKEFFLIKYSTEIMIDKVSLVSTEGYVSVAKLADMYRLKITNNEVKVCQRKIEYP